MNRECDLIWTVSNTKDREIVIHFFTDTVDETKIKTFYNKISHDLIIKGFTQIEDCFENPIALHIRRGDFLINSDNHYNQSIDYYEKALSKFDSKQQVIIFSDDPEWCVSQDLFASDRFNVSSGNGPYHDLYMVTRCEDFIIANSTFSWWGAWLANRGRVIAPSKWFGPSNAHLGTEDLYPSFWEVI